MRARISVVCSLLGLLLACVPKARQESRQVLSISVEKQTSFIRNFNPLLTSGSAREFSVGAIYEPLLIYNRMTGELLPWLATSYKWEGEDFRKLRLTLRPGVQWSDGRDMTAADVVFTFQLLKKFPALDAGGVWSFLSQVESQGTHDVVFTMQRTYTPGLAVLANQVIVPEHIWSAVKDPVQFANPEPVGTGPFTRVTLFEDQVFELGRNPNYWQPGKPSIEGLRFPAFASNDQANLALIQGDVDLAANFIPAVDRIFVKKDPAHHHYWFPLVGPMIFLYLNTQKEPFQSPIMRKALSMAIDRQRIADVALYRYTEPPHASGLTDAYRRWRKQPSAEQSHWTGFHPEEAMSLLEREGWSRQRDGKRRNAEGKVLSLEITVVNGWSDWVRAAQIIASQLEAVGVDAKVKAKDFGSWFEGLQKGQFEGSISWSGESSDPYGFYRWIMDETTVKPLDELTPGNWHRFADARATALMREWERTVDVKRQEEISASLQDIFMQEAPAIPLFPAPAWGTFNSTYFEGFPHAGNPYATLSPNYRPEILLVLNAIKPRQKGL
ncbi:MAG TPA: ABC transporter substrate-binding protein [Oligoflexus sp.]|uniref:ABC transporter substrate-binding protein n=1 Tax=Oligoflexus sp. TaxID=1971216 RepID=UPI002D48B8EE|nr:ABC transporter substrate-binding protein [Oligoflexus sp.]HYX33392.1 ABC transporter substrate-binding protein [Oligoflexus sp.]